jgi:ribosomal protein S18 acetylase RimI-like enzyme
MTTDESTGRPDLGGRPDHVPAPGALVRAETPLAAPAAGAARARATPDTIRAGVPSDLDGCVALLALHEADPGAGVVPHGRTDRRDRVRAWFERPRSCLLVAETWTSTDDQAARDPADRIVGYARAVFLDPTPTAPAGYYLGGVVVATRARRAGLGSRLTEARLAWIAERDSSAWYFTNARNTASIRLHEQLGFHEETREFAIPDVEFAGGAGVLGHLTLDGGTCPAAGGPGARFPR